jgi:hypothetical protein
MMNEDNIVIEMSILAFRDCLNSSIGLLQPDNLDVLDELGDVSSDWK